MYMITFFFITVELGISNHWNLSNYDINDDDAWNQYDKLMETYSKKKKGGKEFLSLNFITDVLILFPHFDQLSMQESVYLV